jgi:hypothetical protein
VPSASTRAERVLEPRRRRQCHSFVRFRINHAGSDHARQRTVRDGCLPLHMPALHTRTSPTVTASFVPSYLPRSFLSFSRSIDRRWLAAAPVRRRGARNSADRFTHGPTACQPPSQQGPQRCGDEISRCVTLSPPTCHCL